MYFCLSKSALLTVTVATGFLLTHHASAQEAPTKQAASASDEANSEPNTKSEHAPPADPDSPPDCRKGFLGLRTLPPECEESRELEYAFLPAVFTQKETGLGIAIYNELNFYADDKPETQSSRVGIALTVTTNKQFIARAPTFLHFNNNDWIVEGFIDFRIYPNRYYGIGNDSTWNYQAYKENVLSFDYEFRRRILGDFYAGVLWDLRSVFAIEEGDVFDANGKKEESPDNGIISTDAPVGFERNINHGLGAQLVYDKRNDFHYPTGGGFHRTSLTGYSKYLGGDYDYLFWVVDARQYIPTFKNQVFALQFLSEFRTGIAPFSSVSEVGGPYQMRGYFRGRYRDNNLLLLQGEYRFPIYKRLSGVAFANTGEVYGKDKRFDIKLLRWTAGAGARFRFGDHTFIRFDMGGNHETFAAIFNGGQAF